MLEQDYKSLTYFIIGIVRGQLNGLSQVTCQLVPSNVQEML